MFIEVLFIIAPNWKQDRYPSGGKWLKKKKKSKVHPHYGILFTNKK